MLNNIFFIHFLVAFIISWKYGYIVASPHVMCTCTAICRSSWWQYRASELCTIYQIELPRGNIAERTQYCSAWPRLQYALNTSAGAGPARSPPAPPVFRRPGPRPPNWPPRYLANNASPRATATSCAVPLERRPSGARPTGTSPPVIAIFIGDAHKYAGQVISSTKWMAEARRRRAPAAALNKKAPPPELGRGAVTPRTLAL